MTQMRPYKYTPLASRSIRVLQLWLGTPDSPLICSLAEISLDDPILEYKALSYCWGEEHPQSPLLIASGPHDESPKQQIPIRPNLVAALSQLRTDTLSCCDLTSSCRTNDAHDKHAAENSHFTRPSNLWIDAICIDQANLDERSQQVGLMHEIYTKASSVIAWLGPENEYTVPAFRMVYTFADLYRDLESDTARRHLATSPSFLSSWIALGHFFANPWWERMWIVQEVVLAQITTVIMGPWSIPWGCFAQAAAVALHNALFSKFAEARLPTGEFAHLWPVISGLHRVHTLGMIRLIVRGLGVWNGEGRGEVISLLAIAFNYKATNPRDKVYGILGLLKTMGLTLGVQPRDDVSVCDVYMHTAEMICQQTGDLMFLEAVENNRMINYARRFDLPSWTPDFAAPTKLLPVSWTRMAEEATRYRQHWGSYTVNGERVGCKFNFKEKTITVRGFRIDTIQALFDDVADLVADITGYRSSSMLENLSNFYPKRIDDCAMPDEETEKSLEETLRRVLGPESKERGMWTATRDGVAANHDRGPKNKLFRTSERGIISHTPIAACPGDAVCWLIGLGFPCILRRQGSKWIYVGLW